MDFISAALGLAREVFSYLNLKESRKYIDECVEIEKDLQAELSKALDQQSDSKIENLYQRLAIVASAAQQALSLSNKSA